MFSIPQLIILLILVLVTVVPPILVLSSNRSQGWAKFGWFVGALFFSWIAYIVFMIVTQKPDDKQV